MKPFEFTYKLCDTLTFYVAPDSIDPGLLAFWLADGPTVVASTTWKFSSEDELHSFLQKMAENNNLIDTDRVWRVPKYMYSFGHELDENGNCYEFEVSGNHGIGIMMDGPQDELFKELKLAIVKQYAPERLLTPELEKLIKGKFGHYEQAVRDLIYKVKVS